MTARQEQDERSGDHEQDADRSAGLGPDLERHADGPAHAPVHGVDGHGDHGVDQRLASAWLLGGAWVVLLLEMLVIRPPLNARTDLVIAGAEPGQSPFHYLYIAADVVLVLLLATLTVVNARRTIPRAVAHREAPVRSSPVEG